MFLSAFIICGFIFRYVGIQKNLSYWNDESHTALRSRGILEYGAPLTEIGHSTGLYQIGLYYLTAGSFKVLGVNEFSGRIPSVFAGTILIFVVFYITKKIIKDERAALLATFLTAFSQIQLAWSTQLRPYIWLELFTLFVTYFSFLFLKNKKSFFDVYLAQGLFWSVIAVLFHGSGFIAVALICFAILAKIVQMKKYSYLISLVPLALLSLLLLRFMFNNAIPQLFNFDFRIWHYIGFFKEFIWLLLPAFFGSIFLWYKNKNLFIILPLFITIIFALAIFKLNTQYVRYSLPAMPLLYILFSIGFFALIDLFTFKQKKQIALLIYVAFFLGFIGAPIVKGKIIVWPKYYYSINADVRENPIVDYKYAFARIKMMIEGKKDVILMDAWNDRVPYYLPGQKFIFLYSLGKGDLDTTYGEKMVGTIKLFEQEKMKYPYGVVIVENWMSMTPEKLQDHIRKTLKHEFTVNNLPYNENDKWSISIYSWGFDK
ncbi:MAG: glycosyltransferase family 39 protein [bacterium]